ncbi:hypothetical protein Q427_31995 [Halomonas sp. BC04]|nr:hypothetical protein Q427_31995 [Halomonas sp. BC04]
MNGISSATVTSITAELLSQGLISERPPETSRSGGRGRPKTLIQLNPEAACVICVKVSINEIQIVVGDFTGQIRHSTLHSLTTLPLTLEELCATLEEKIEAIRADVVGTYHHLAGICLAVQGVVSPNNG